MEDNNKPSKKRNVRPMADGMTYEQLHCVEVMADPNLQHLTQKEVAEMVNVDTSTIRRWKKSSHFIDELEKATRKKVSLEIPKLNSILIQKAREGSFKHLELVYRLAGYIGNDNQVSVNIDNRQAESRRNIIEILHEKDHDMRNSLPDYEDKKKAWEDGEE